MREYFIRESGGAGSEKPSGSRTYSFAYPLYSPKRSDTVLTIDSPQSWFHARGVITRANKLKARGLPDVRGWRFVTCSVDPSRFGSALAAYLAGKKRIRHFIGGLRRLFGAECKYCWKLEFQGNGWPHWHFFVEHKKKLTRPQLLAVRDAWFLGRTNVKRARDLEYLWKYSFKRPFAHDDEPGTLTVPDWFADHIDAKTGKTFLRARMFQSSPGFFLKNREQVIRPPAKPPTKCLVYHTIRDYHKYFDSCRVSVHCGSRWPKRSFSDRPLSHCHEERRIGMESGGWHWIDYHTLAIDEEKLNIKIHKKWLKIKRAANSPPSSNRRRNRGWYSMGASPHTGTKQ